MTSEFYWIRPAQEALNEYRDIITKTLDNESISYRLGRDFQCTRSSNTEYNNASEISKKALNKQLEEPSKIVIFFLWDIWMYNQRL